MKARFELTNLSEVEATLTCTMTVGEWRSLKEQLDTAEKSGSSPSWEFRAMITELIEKADKHFTATKEDL